MKGFLIRSGRIYGGLIAVVFKKICGRKACGM
jgi:hypothetical protein